MYADLGYADPEEMLAKAALVQQIQETMVARGLSQIAAAKIVGMDQPSLSKLLRGIIRNVTLDRLSLILRRLGRDVF
ncbi:MAG: helix-turn-helix domain-containing protein, partial [Pirellula sp.]